MLRQVQLFVSSTFDDFVEERSMLADTVMPMLNDAFAPLGVEVSFVDFRWGITQAEAESGATVGRCLDAVDKCRPYFVGMLGNRYGWVPPASQFSSDLVSLHSWLQPHIGRTSATELEVLHGVLNRPAGSVRALFLFRDPQFDPSARPFFLRNSAAPESNHPDRERMADLRQRIRDWGAHVIEDYSDPGAFLDLVQPALYELIQDEIGKPPPRGLPLDMAHDLAVRRLASNYLPRPREEAALQSAIDASNDLIVIHGQEGCGKSALMAHLATRLHDAGEAVFIHRIGISPFEDGIRIFAGRLQLWAAQACGIDPPKEVPHPNPDAALRAVFSQLAARTAAAGTRWFLLIDGIDRFGTEGDFSWLPASIPAGMTIVASTADAVRAKALHARAQRMLAVSDLAREERRTLLSALLRRAHKMLDEAIEEGIIATPACANPKALELLFGELCIAARQETLEDFIRRAEHCANLEGVYDFMLKSLESILGPQKVRDALTLIHLTRGWLAEDELGALAGISRGNFLALRNALGDALTSKGGVPLAIASGALRAAVERSYLDRPSEVRGLHRWIASFLAKGPASRIGLGELAFHLEQGGEMRKLRELLLDPAVLDAKSGLPFDDMHCYWLRLEVSGHEDIVEAYKEAWPRWQAKIAKDTQSVVARRLADFLLAYGRSGLDFIGMLYGIAAQRAQLRDEPADLETFHTLVSLGNFLLQAGLARDAVPALEKAIDVGCEILGEDHLTIAVVLNNLGFTLMQLGRLEEAKESFQQALEIRTRLLGREHSDVAQCVMNLGHLHLKLRELTEAELCFLEACNIRERVLPEEHPDLALSRMSYGQLLLEMGRRSEARKWLTIAVSRLKDYYGAHHEYVRMANASLERSTEAGNSV